MKSVLFTILLVSSTSAHAGWGDVLNKVLDAVGGRVNCVATYNRSRSTPFGQESNRVTRNIKAARSVGDACAIAKDSQEHRSTPFGYDSTSLSSLHCTNEKRISFPVNTTTCEVALGN